MRKWLGVQRYLYNKCVALVINGIKPTQKELRAVLLNGQTNTLEETERWLDEYDYDLKDEAVRDFMKNYNSNMAKYRKDGKPFSLKFRSKRAPTQSLSVLKKKWNRGERSFYHTIFSPSKLKSAEPLPEKLTRDCRLVRTRLGEYFLMMPNKGTGKHRGESQDDFVFIDPGVRTFLTCYDSQERVVEIGRNAVVRIGKLLHHRRKLQTKLANERGHKRRQNLRRAYLRLGARTTHLVEDMHKKAALFLCQNYSHVFLPKLNFHGCRGLNRRSKSSMATFAHCAFFDRAVMKAAEFRDCEVREVSEEWTSKTCSGCGTINHGLGAAKVFVCVNAQCGVVFDRDFNAAKNIMLKYFTEHGGEILSGSIPRDAAMLGPSPAAQQLSS